MTDREVIQRPWMPWTPATQERHLRWARDRVFVRAQAYDGRLTAEHLRSLIHRLDTEPTQYDVLLSEYGPDRVPSLFTQPNDAEQVYVEEAKQRMVANACDHQCKVNEETLLPERRHFLDCPVWEYLLTRKLI